MANTFTQIHIQCVFAVKFRQSLIQADWQDRLYSYITGFIQNQGHKMIAINGMPDHVHIFFGFRPNQSLSDLMRIVKSDSSEWINKEKFTSSTFRWQEGYAAFSYSRSHINAVATYIENQQERHKTRTFLEEYKQLLEKFEIEFDERYIFTLPE